MADEVSKGISCPACGANSWKVDYKRLGDGLNKRRLICKECEAKIVTHERMVGVPVR